MRQDWDRHARVSIKQNSFRGATPSLKRRCCSRQFMEQIDPQLAR
jgi:hypothetical protein